MEEEKTIQFADKKFKIRRGVILLLLAAAFTSLVTYDPTDLEYFAGGLSNAVGYPHNWLGILGTYLGWTLLATFGLASYAMLLLAIVCCLRRLWLRGNLRKSYWDYYFAALGYGIGCSMLLGLNPNFCQNVTEALNISRMPGGILGNWMCAPESGWLYTLLSSVGSGVIALVFIVVSLIVIWNYDWALLASDWMEKRAAERLKKGNAPLFPGLDPGHREPIFKAPEQETAVPQQQNLQFNEPAPQTTAPVYDDEPAWTQASAVEYVPEESMGDELDQEPEFEPEPVVPVQPRVQPAPMPPKPAPRPEPVVARVAPAPAPMSASAAVLADYALPRYSCLDGREMGEGPDLSEFEEKKERLQNLFDQCRLDAEVHDYIVGPQATLFRIEVSQSMNVGRFISFQKNITMAVRSKSQVRLLLPILGTDMVGVEVPNNKREIVTAGELFATEVWRKNKMIIPVMLGKNLNGDAVMMDLAKAPHALIAGQTGSGKSICMFMLLASLLYRFSPEELRLVIVDPKFVDYGPYEHLPHLLCPLIREPEKVSLPLNWAITEMNRRLAVISSVGCRDILEFNSRRKSGAPQLDAYGEPIPDKMPFIVIIIDELSDLMCSNRKKEIERAIQILGQKARAAGIHMVLATQRPDVKVITGNIKANIPIRIAFKTTSSTDSRTILDSIGAEDLTGMGDMLYLDKEGNTHRLQGGWITNDENKRITTSCSTQMTQDFNPTIMEMLAAADRSAGDGESADWPAVSSGDNGGVSGGSSGGTSSRLSKREQLLHDAMEQIIARRQPTISFVQRVLHIGYNNAVGVLEELQEMGYVSAELPGTRGQREILKWTPPFSGDDDTSADEEYYDDGDRVADDFSPAEEESDNDDF